MAEKTTAVATRNIPSLMFHGKCEPVSWTPESKSLSYVKWEEAGRMMGAYQLAIQWWVADWLSWGEDRYGEKYAQAIDGTGRDVKTLLTWLRVAKAVPVERRREELLFSHHVVVSTLEPEQQTYWLAKAIEGDTRPNGEVVPWSSRRLKAEIAGAGQEAEEPDVEVEVVDKELIPRVYLVPDIKAIRSAVGEGCREIAGLKLIIDGVEFGGAPEPGNEA